MKNKLPIIFVIGFVFTVAFSCSETDLEFDEIQQNPISKISLATLLEKELSHLQKADELFNKSYYHHAKLYYDSALIQNTTPDNIKLIKQKISNCVELNHSQSSLFSNTERSLLGSKKFGVQFIWDGYGKAEISKENETIKFDGKQYSKDKSEYLLMNGDMTIIDEKKLSLKGSIKLYTKDCCGIIEEEGTFIFLKSGKRKFWRLQERGKLCDIYKCSYYIDIFQ
jgi:hypothetical protein